jgi:hypothetical protein
MRWLTKRERDRSMHNKTVKKKWFAWHPVRSTSRPEQWFWLEIVHVYIQYEYRYGSLWKDYEYYGL